MPVASDDSMEREVASERGVANRLPVLQIVAEPAKQEAPSPGTNRSAFADSVREPTSGHRPFEAGRSRRIIATAIETLPRAEITEVDVMRKAIASI